MLTKDKACHRIRCSEEVWLAITQFQEQNNITDRGQAVQALLDFFLRFKNQYYEGYKQKAEKAEQLKAEIEEQKAEAVAAIKSLMESGLNVQSILYLHELVQAAGIPIDDLRDELQEVGSLKELISQLNEEVNDLIEQRAELDKELAEAQAKAFSELEVLAKKLDEERKALDKKLVDERIRAADELAAAKSQVLALEEKAEEYQELLASTDQQIAKIREFAGQVEQTYRILGLILHTIINQQFVEAKTSRIEHLPLSSLLFLAGSILTVAEEMYGDRVFEMRISRENMVPVRVRLSEIPALFAPTEAYRAQRNLIFQQMEMAEAYADGNGAGNSTVIDNA